MPARAAHGVRLDGPTGGRLLVWQRAVAVAAHLPASTRPSALPTTGHRLETASAHSSTVR